MFRDEYIPLIKALVQSTKAGLLAWSKGQSHLAYASQPTPEQTILVDKYFSIVDEQSNTCINLTIFASDDTIIDEIVLCKAVDEPNNFDLLDSLYQEVEAQYARNSSTKVPPVLNHITESLSAQLLHAH
jgi:hypothetical protein